MSAMLIIAVAVQAVMFLLLLGDWFSCDVSPQDSRIALRILIAAMIFLSGAMTGHVLYQVYPGREAPTCQAEKQ